MDLTRKLIATVALIGVFDTGATAQSGLFPKQSGAAASGAQKPLKTRTARHALTIGIPSFLDGFTALTYERRLSSSFALGLGGGITYHNFWMETGELKREAESLAVLYRRGAGMDVTERYADAAYHVPKPGAYISVLPKYYFGKQALNGIYIAPLLEYRNYRFLTYKASEAEFARPPYYYSGGGDEQGVLRAREKVREYVNCFDISAVMGGQYQMRGRSVLGFHIGVGVRNARISRQDIGVEMLSNQFIRYTNTMRQSADTRLLANVGLNVGAWW